METVKSSADETRNSKIKLWSSMFCSRIAWDQKFAQNSNNLPPYMNASRSGSNQIKRSHVSEIRSS